MKTMSFSEIEATLKKQSSFITWLEKHYKIDKTDSKKLYKDILSFFSRIYPHLLMKKSTFQETIITE
jgi:hypothetical protein